MLLGSVGHLIASANLTAAKPSTGLSEGDTVCMTGGALNLLSGLSDEGLNLGRDNLVINMSDTYRSDVK